MSERLKFAAVTLGLLVLGVAAHAQSGAPTNCSGTVSTATAAIVFPSSGSGPPRPQKYLSISNPGTTASLCVNPNAAAVIGGAGCIPIFPGSIIWWSSQEGMNPPASINIIADTASTPFSCHYE